MKTNQELQDRVTELELQVERLREAGLRVLTLWDQGNGALVSHFPTGKPAIEALRTALAQCITAHPLDANPVVAHESADMSDKALASRVEGEKRPTVEGAHARDRIETVHQLLHEFRGTECRTDGGWCDARDHAEFIVEALWNLDNSEPPQATAEESSVVQGEWEIFEGNMSAACEGTQVARNLVEGTPIERISTHPSQWEDVIPGSTLWSGVIYRRRTSTN